jgi:cation:H+ antiporter
MSWILFLISSLAIVVAGTKLSQHGDRIAECSGLGRLWIGAVLLAAATSLPEVFTAASATLMNEPDIAVGDLLGAGLNNMLILAIVDLIYRGKRVWQQAAMEQLLLASLALILTALAALFMIIQPSIAVWHTGLGTCAIAVIYVLGMRVVFRQEDMRRRNTQLGHVVASERVATPTGVAGGLQSAVIGFTVMSLAILLAAPVLAYSAKNIAEITGLSTSFVGTTLVAIATSLPELVTSLAAVRIGAFDLAVGNLFGSNAFNMAALFVADLAYSKGALLAGVRTSHVITALLVVLLMSVAAMGIVYRAEKRFIFVEPDSYLLIISYLFGIGLLFSLG